ncbi:hypothetical protein [Rhodococcus koreensis]|uniref:hypothetical protein n=1 Tax=Rhodococcus koreensis TaxID=99653 RepID=UPI00197CD455|nr:hypothetical protein [Rhodococcus koreensis]QSE86575.1 hypothetical protein JWS14_46640 [Rhodococcus koreensis]
MKTYADFADWSEFRDAVGPGYVMALHELTVVVGSAFLDYVYANDSGHGLRYVVPTPEQCSVLEELYALWKGICQSAPEPDERRLAIARAVGEYVDDLKTSRAAEWHERCGGRVPTTVDDGSVEAAFKILARDLLGFRILGTTHINLVLDMHPTRLALNERFGTHEPLLTIFENAIAAEPEQSPLLTVVSESSATDASNHEQSELLAAPSAAEANAQPGEDAEAKRGKSTEEVHETAVVDAPEEGQNSTDPEVDIASERQEAPSSKDARAATLEPERLAERQNLTMLSTEQLWTDGSRSTLHFSELPWAILGNAGVTRFQPRDVVAAVQKSTLENLAVARRLSAGETVTVPTVVGLRGLRLSDDVDSIQGDGIRLRRSTPLDFRDSGDGSQIPTIVEIDTEFECLENCVRKAASPTAPAQFHQRADPTKEEYKRRSMNEKKIRAHRDSLDRKMERLRFAILLSGSDEVLGSTTVFTTTVSPLSQSARPLLNSASYPEARELSTQVADQLRDWLPKVTAMPTHLVLSMRRLLRAASERHTPDDQLVDAVVAWEGLLGGYPEIRFQTTGSMAVLLAGSDMERRMKIWEDGGKIYGLRSKLVHGANIAGGELQADSQLALELGIEVVQKILSDPELAAEPKSDKRCRRILLGF